MVRKLNANLITTSGDTSGNIFSIRSTGYVDAFLPGDTQIAITNVMTTDVTFSTFQPNLYDSGGYIKVLGRNFDNGTTLYIGNTNTSFQLAPVTFTSNSELRATVPAINVLTNTVFSVFALSSKGYSTIRPNATRIDTFKSYSLSRSATNVNEGNTFVITLTTVGVSNGTSVPYSITGVSSSDIANASLTGNFVIQNNANSVTFTVTSDLSTEGSETFALGLTSTPATNTTVSINDTSVTPTYTLSRSAASVNEGGSFTITLTTTGVNNGTSVPYTITGVTSADISNVSLTGNFVIQSGSNTIVFTAMEDSLTEGNESFTIALDGRAESISVTINDTSVPIDPNTQSPNALWISGGNGVPAVSRSTIQKLTFASDTVSPAVRGNMSFATHNHTVTGDNTYMWSTGGFYQPSPGTGTSAIDRTTFATDTATGSSRGYLITRRRIFTSHHNYGTIMSYGWFVGGINLPIPGSMISSVERMTFATDTATNSARGSLNYTKYNHCGAGNADYNWTMGGEITSTNNFSSMVERITYSTDTATATNRGNLLNVADSRHIEAASLSNNDYQWAAGFQRSQIPAYDSYIQRLTYASDTVAVSARGQIGLNIGTRGASGNSTDGWFLGGYDPSLGTISRVHRINYATDTATAALKSPLAERLNYPRASSGYA